MITIKEHQTKLLTVVFPGGQQRTRNCAYSAIPSDRRPAGNLPKQTMEIIQSEFNTTVMSYREFAFRRRVFAGLVVMLWLIAAVYFYIVSL